ncbi:glycosyltransferase family 4 protein [Thermocrinis sp.]|uniref:glycosyltransferase family 4 protein n=1 Tax=Thermocrinis sp. TaxID=2024383 RepID=UPI002FDEBAD9
MEKIIVFSSNTSFSLYNFRLPLMKTLKEKGFKVMAVAPEDEYSVKLAKEGFDFYPIKNLDRKGKDPIRDLKLLYEYLSLYKKLKPDLVINFTIKPNIYSSIASGILGISSISVVTGLGYVFTSKTWLTNLVKLLYKIAFRVNKIVVFQNKDDFEELKGLTDKKAHLIESSGVDTGYFSPFFCEKNKKEKFIFLFVGRFLKDKGLLEFVKAFERLKVENPKVELYLVGDVDEGNPQSIKGEELKRWLDKGLANWVGFQKDVRHFYCLADCVVLPSYYREGVPRVLLEAMAMGKPIITTDSVGCREVCVDGVNGFLVEPKNWESLYEAMKRMVELEEDKRKSMGMKGRQMVLERYDVKIIVEKYLKLIELVV